MTTCCSSERDLLINFRNRNDNEYKQSKKISGELMRSADAIIGEYDVKQIAKRFLEQHHSIHSVKEAVLEDDIWTVTVLISSYDNQSRKVRIDAKSGMIIGWYK